MMELKTIHIFMAFAVSEPVIPWELLRDTTGLVVVASLKKQMTTMTTTTTQQQPQSDDNTATVNNGNLQFCFCFLAATSLTHYGVKINNIFSFIFCIDFSKKNIWGEVYIGGERERLGGFLRVKCLYACVCVCV